jgi:hypothetical protein
MNSLAQAIKNLPDALTDNGALTYSSSSNPIVDLFFLIGGASLNTVPITSIIRMFEDAYLYDTERAVRVLCYTRDARGGAGRREIFRQVMQYLEVARPSVVMQLLPFVATYGRFDDLFIFQTKAIKAAAYAVWAKSISERNGLAAKWAPRQATPKDQTAKELREFLGLTPKQYRKLLVSLTTVVESKMCSREWEDINYSHVPSLASIRYAKAFGRHDQVRYQEFKNKVQTGEVKVNTGAIYPHDVIVSLRNGDSQLADGMWKQMPDLTEGASILPIVDVSGSMSTQIQGNVTAMDISISLGMYLAMKTKGPFANLYMTFSENPNFVQLDPNVSLYTNYEKVNETDVGCNTNLVNSFKLLLMTAIKNHVSQADMPEMVLVLSDMQIDEAQCYGEKLTNFQVIDQMYQVAGYIRPRLVFWNINGGEENSPVRFDEDGTGLVSGFSPSILKSILKAKEFTPMSIVDEILFQPRYDLPFN